MLLFTVTQMCRARITADPIPESPQDLIEVDAVRPGLRPRRPPAAAAPNPILAKRLRCSCAGRRRVIGRRVEPPTDPDDDEPAGTAPRPAPRLRLRRREAFGPRCRDAAAHWGTSGDGYRVFTRAYDETRSSRPWSDPVELLRTTAGDSTSHIDSAAPQRPETRTATEDSAVREPVPDGWEGGREEGYLDGRRLAQLVPSPTERRLFRAERTDRRPTRR